MRDIDARAPSPAAGKQRNTIAEEPPTTRHIKRAGCVSWEVPPIRPASVARLPPGPSNAAAKDQNVTDASGARGREGGVLRAYLVRRWEGRPYRKRAEKEEEARSKRKKRKRRKKRPCEHTLGCARQQVVALSSGPGAAGVCDPHTAASQAPDHSRRPLPLAEYAAASAPDLRHRPSDL